MKVTLLVNTTINGVFYESGTDVEVTPEQHVELVMLGSCRSEIQSTKVESKHSSSGNKFFKQKR